MSDELLSATDIYAGYNGDVPVVRGVSFSLYCNQVLAVIGPNGSGKSTLLKAILGIVPRFRGAIRLLGQTWSRVSPQAMIRAGVGYVPQGHQVFPELTVQENLEMGCYWMDLREARRAMEVVLERLPSRAAGVLSGGEQQLVSVGRALTHRPRILLIDEPSAGLSPGNTSAIFDILGELRATGVGMMLVEQNARMALEFAEHALVLDMGKIRISGAARQLLDDPGVRAVYLGDA